ncbi:MAG: response regulator [Chryseolinea sp.]
MIIDDDEDDRELFQSIVGRNSPTIKCSEAANGLLALEALKNNSPLPDLIFLDLNMPVMNGKQFLSEMKSSNELKDIPVVILTTSSDPQTKKELMDLGVFEFLTKPDRIKQWESSITEILERIKLALP